MNRGRRNPPWSRLPEEDLLDVRLCDLGLDIAHSPLAERIERLRGELARRGLRFAPHVWLSEEWFCPDGVPGIAMPFYLAHPRLVKLEQRMMLDAEGSTERQCMQFLRHEAGHAIDNAYRLHQRPRWQSVFGDYGRRYPRYYVPRPRSRKHVLHLDWWYAQSHPAEDFAETFAVWLQPGSRWCEVYRGWPALRKLEYVDEVMRGIVGVPARVRTRRHVDPLSANRRTLREYYAEKRGRFDTLVPDVYDADLERLFVARPQGNGRRRTAAAFLREAMGKLCQVCAHGTGAHPYCIAQLVREMIARCRELKLHVGADGEHQIMTDVAVSITVQTLHYLNKVHHKIPV